ncbi:hypothetical protein MJT46_012453 [Ovis ammon polii x Ovis aries]|nr:hypothetical protein MJT46_012453 [Ovis ammon polii x Ovis aries]
MAKMSLKEQREWQRQRPEGAAAVWATVGETGVKIGSAAGLGGLGLVSELRENSVCVWPFQEMEQLHLAKQLEGLRATLGLGTKEDMTPKLNYGVQEDGRDPGNRQRAAAKDPRSPGRSPRVSSCLQPGIFLFFLLIQTVGFFCYVHFRSAKTMAFMVKTMVGGQLKNLTGSLGGCEDKGDGDKSAAEAQGMSREEYEEYQKQLVEEKMERDAQFTQRKAERATLRSHFRDKYRLPKNETDESQIQMAGGDVELPRELAKMIEEDTEEEEERASVLGQLASLPGLDLGSLKDKAQSTLGDLKQSAERCHIM